MLEDARRSLTRGSEFARSSIRVIMGRDDLGAADEGAAIFATKCAGETSSLTRREPGSLPYHQGRLGLQLILPL